MTFWAQTLCLDLHQGILSDRNVSNVSSKMYLVLVPLDLISPDTHHDTFLKSVSREDNFKGNISDFLMSFRVVRTLPLVLEFINTANIFSFTSQKSFVIMIESLTKRFLEFVNSANIFLFTSQKSFVIMIKSLTKRFIN